MPPVALMLAFVSQVSAVDYSAARDDLLVRRIAWSAAKCAATPGSKPHRAATVIMRAEGLAPMACDIELVRSVATCLGSGAEPGCDTPEVAVYREIVGL